MVKIRQKFKLIISKYKQNIKQRKKTKFENDTRNRTKNYNDYINVALK